MLKDAMNSTYFFSLSPFNSLCTAFRAATLSYIFLTYFIKVLAILFPIISFCTMSDLIHFSKVHRVYGYEIQVLKIYTRQRND